MEIKQTQLFITVATLFAMTGVFLIVSEFKEVLVLLFHFGDFAGLGEFGPSGFDIGRFPLGFNALVKVAAGVVFVVARNRIAEYLVFSHEMFKPAIGHKGGVRLEGMSGDSGAPAAPRSLWREIMPMLALAFIGYLFVVDAAASLVQTLVAYGENAAQQAQAILGGRNVLLFPFLLAIFRLLIGIFLISKRSVIVDMWQRHHPLSNV